MPASARSRTAKRARLKELPHNEYSEVWHELVPAEVVSLEAVTHGRAVDGGDVHELEQACAASPIGTEAGGSVSRSACDPCTTEMAAWALLG
jgi:hypothetical protein